MTSFILRFSFMIMSVFLIGCGTESVEVSEPVVRPVKLLKISDPAYASKHVFPAKVAATKRSELAFRLSGHLTELFLNEGDTVKKGMVLARLDNRDTRNAFLHREAEHELAEADFKRKEKLLHRKLISQADYDLAKAQVKSARANLASARDQLSYTELKAPYDGVIAKILIDNYQMVQANQSILVLQKDRSIDVVIQVPETLMNHLFRLYPNPSIHANVSFAIRPDLKFPAKIREHSTQITPGTQSYEVTFTLPQPKEVTVLPGMSAELMVNFTSEQSTQIQAILPANAISKRDSDGKSIIWVMDEETGVVHSKVVSIGRITGEGVEITHGVNIGDQVVIAGVQSLVEGLKVKPLRQQRGV
ncbi:efflux RND transporter periplasmic adaptor subunit [Vibrio algivorus]|uniref:Efflux RND transporter periplasmic adaptor subunit n=1 Tax=Vibrio algivorus TaxID=1667024 RepID=A0A557NXG3_9VIBR|nr:efflux RND transporter periplasmic adaptor subunit [Vibrio algivorus]TVO33077.1 efflux RND transporter periplasmic adaptor subunit [Vibrio algivorus]